MLCNCILHAAVLHSAGSPVPSALLFCNTCICLVLLRCQVSLLITMNVLADVLVDDKELKQQLMQQAGETSTAAAVDSSS
jgi:hypothetical protein